jgi:hypothetical protein
LWGQWGSSGLTKKMSLSITSMYLLLTTLAVVIFEGYGALAAPKFTEPQMQSFCPKTYGSHSLTHSTIPLQKRVPNFTPIMITAPFAGATLAREIMEYGTGFFTGSFGDPHIKGIVLFPWFAQFTEVT